MIFNRESSIVAILVVLICHTLPKCHGYIKLQFSNERNSLCNHIKIFGTPTQLLGHHDNSGLIIDDEFYHSNLWKQDLVCTFKIEHPIGTNGVIAVIQSLNMRKDESGGCMDFVQFKAKDGSSSDKFCGKFDVVSKMNSARSVPDIINYSNSFRTKGHKMMVNITLGREPLKSRNERIEFKIVFTAYINCSKDTKWDLSYRPCKEPSEMCIYTGFFDDGYVNCPFAGCVDEGSCSKYVVLPKTPSVETKLLVGSISFFVVLFITFLLSIWGCKKHKVGCFSEQFSQPHTSQQVRNIEMNEQLGTSTAAASAPTIEIDKDLPPKYEDLFPDR